jgi:exonuclease SbcC
MRILKLTIENIAPYKKKQVIDFDSLPELFLVYGPTGSGKSTIFDCVSLALYNKTAGETEKGNPVYPSNGEKVIGRLKLEFSVNEQIYVIVREYEKDKSSKVVLYLPNGETVQKQVPVLMEIEKLLGLTHQQFIRSSIIAQGEFQKILRAGTRERQELLQSIFNTDRYETLISGLRDEYNAAQKILNEESLKWSTILNGRTVEEVKSELNSCELELTKLVAEVTKSKNQVTDIQNSLMSFKAKQKTLEDITTTKSSLSSLQDELLTAINKSQDVKNQIERCNKLIEENQYLLDRLDCVATIREDIESLNKVFSGLEKRKQELNQQKDEQEKSLQGLKVRMSRLASEFKEKTLELEAEEARLPGLRKAQEKQQSIASELSRLMILDSRFKEIEKQYRNSMDLAEHDRDTSQVQLRPMQVVEQEIERYTKDLEEAKKDYKATLIAELVQLGEEGICPVCGNSLESCQDSVNSEATKVYASIKSILDRLILEKTSIIENSRKIQEKYELTVKRITDEYQKELATTPTDLNEKITSTSREEQDYVGADAAVNKSIQKIGELKASLRDPNELLPLIEDYSMLLANTTKELDVVKTTLIDTVDALTDKEKQLNELSVSEELLKPVRHAQATLKLLVLEEYELGTNITKLRTRVEATQEYLDKLPIIEESLADLEQHILCGTAALSKQEQHTSAIEDNINQLSGSLAVLKSTLERCTAAGLGFMKAETDFKEAASFEVLWKAKVGIGAYAVAYYLEAILDVTNTILTTIRPRYRLCRDTEEGGRGKKGLDLLVYDMESSQTRPVETLSGGETFILSLALAIGSAITYSRFNNKMPDLLLLDEGFGTLDKQTLDEVLEMLRQISKTCKIGIISHVTSLQTKIGVNLEVGVGVDGSYVHQLKGGIS